MQWLPVAVRAELILPDLPDGGLPEYERGQPQQVRQVPHVQRLRHYTKINPDQLLPEPV